MYADTVSTNNQVLRGVIESAVKGIAESYPYQSPLEKKTSDELLAALNHVLMLLEDGGQLPQRNERSNQQQDAITQFDALRAQYINAQGRAHYAP